MRILVALFVVACIAACSSGSDMGDCHCCVYVYQLNQEQKTGGFVAFVVKYKDSFYLVFDSANHKKINGLTRVSIWTNRGMATSDFRRLAASKTAVKSQTFTVVRVADEASTECEEIAAILEDVASDLQTEGQFFVSSMYAIEATFRKKPAWVHIPVEIIGVMNDSRFKHLGTLVGYTLPVPLPNVSPVLELSDGKYQLRGILENRYNHATDGSSLRLVFSTKRLIDAIKQANR